MMEIKSSSAQETFELAKKLAGKAKSGEIVALVGDLGVGKTVFAKGFAAGLGIDEPVTSPTFTIVCEYEGRLPFYHFDVYRIEDYEELFEIGFEEYLYGNGVCLIEWADLIQEDLPDTHISVSIEKTVAGGSDVRIIKIENYEDRK